MTGQKFEHWLAAVDRVLCKFSGLSHKDLPDVDWHKLWESGMAASHAARKVLIDTFGSL